MRWSSRSMTASSFKSNRHRAATDAANHAAAIAAAKHVDIGCLQVIVCIKVARG